MENKFDIDENGKASESQIDIWKKQYKEVFEIEVEGKFCYIRGFDRTTMKYALSRLKIELGEDNKPIMNPGDMLEIGEVGLQNCWIAGSEEIQTNESINIAVCFQVGELFNLAQTTLKKL